VIFSVFAVMFFPVLTLAGGGGTFTDPRNGRTYRMVTIGTQTWMAENLNFRPRTDNTWCYDHDNSNCEKYGRLYTWDAARSACPAGWRLPTQRDWSDLAREIGGKDAAGQRLKSETGWNNNGNGTDDFGFSALPGGYRFLDASFGGVGDYGFWWSATEIDRSNASCWIMDATRGGVYENHDSKNAGFSVRCVKR
jgi:uncharacterized protein (TIGR02145 family)